MFSESWKCRFFFFMLNRWGLYIIYYTFVVDSFEEYSYMMCVYWFAQRLNIILVTDINNSRIVYFWILFHARCWLRNESRDLFQLWKKQHCVSKRRIALIKCYKALRNKWAVRLEAMQLWNTGGCDTMHLPHTKQDIIRKCQCVSDKYHRTAGVK